MTPPLRIVRVARVLSAVRRASSMPVVAESATGERVLVKLRGAAQGSATLVSEVIAGELAERIGLSVPERLLVELPPHVPSLDTHEELRDLLDRSAGENLGFAFLEGARDVTLADAARIDPGTAARILWFDALLQNPDRTPKNPNLMIRRGRVFLIDHGAALPFQFDWDAVTEATPGEPGFSPAHHLLSHARAAVPGVDAELARRLTRESLEAAVARVPDAFLAPLAGASPSHEDSTRLRAAYVAYLWKRLKAPRRFANGADDAQ